MSERLSPTQRVALRAVAETPGRFPVEYPGGMRTIRSLVKRGLVRVDEQRRGTWIEHRVYATDDGTKWAHGHVHVFKFSAHADGCHWWVSTSVCECGAVLRQTAERDPERDPGSLLWMDDPTCERCTELIEGAMPDDASEVFMPDGSAVPA